MEGLSGSFIARFSARGRVSGLLFGIRGRLYCVGAMQRGICWRFGIEAFNPARGFWTNTFGLRTRIKQIEMMTQWGMRDEVIPVRFRPNWIRGSLHFRRSGCIEFVITASDPEIFSPEPRKNPEIFSSLEVEDTSYYEPCKKERY